MSKNLKLKTKKHDEITALLLNEEVKYRIVGYIVSVFDKEKGVKSTNEIQIELEKILEYNYSVDVIFIFQQYNFSMNKKTNRRIIFEIKPFSSINNISSVIRQIKVYEKYLSVFNYWKILLSDSAVNFSWISLLRESNLLYLNINDFLDDSCGFDKHGNSISMEKIYNEE